MTTTSVCWASALLRSALEFRYSASAPIPPISPPPPPPSLFPHSVCQGDGAHDSADLGVPHSMPVPLELDMLPLAGTLAHTHSNSIRAVLGSIARKWLCRLQGMSTAAQGLGRGPAGPMWV